MKQHINLNNNWLFLDYFSAEMVQDDYADSNWQKVRLPHCPAPLSLNYFDYSSQYHVYCYRKKLILSENLKGKNVFLSFNGIGHLSTVYLNGHIIGRHACGYTTFEVPLLLSNPEHSQYSVNPNQFVKLGKQNIITVCVDSRQLNIPPFGSATDFLTYGGIYREASLEIRDFTYIKSIFTTTPDAGKLMKTLHSEVVIGGDYNETDIRFILYDHKKNIVTEQIVHASKETVSMESCSMKYHCWSPDDPYLYTMHVELLKYGKIIDSQDQPVGFRDTEFRKNGFFCNEQPYKLFGINRNQCFPYVGYAMPKGPQEQDALIIKKELGFNAVRCFGGPPSKYFLDACDRLGLFVLIDLPGWSYIGDDDWQNHAKENLKDIIIEHRHHPCIIAWESSISNASTNKSFCSSLNSLAHSLDPSRQTYGVTNNLHEDHPEDVIGFNDYINPEQKIGFLSKIQRPEETAKPMFISEFCGYMYPCKSSDNEEARLKHALIYCDYFNSMEHKSKIAGAFGWCMCDYPTLPQFGSGDGISYLGIMDSFRNPKLAAYAMASQSEDIDTFIVSSNMNGGDYTGGYLKDIYAFTNAGYIRIYKNGQYIMGYTPNDSPYTHLPHPPILINDFIGNLLETNEGFSKSDAKTIKDIFSDCVKYGKKLSDKNLAKLSKIMVANHKTEEYGINLYEKYLSNHVATPSTYTFEAVSNSVVTQKCQLEPAKKITMHCLIDRINLTDGDFYDVSCIRIRLEDNNGNHLPYYHGTISFQTSGPLELIGPSVISITGGYAGTYVRTIGHTGMAALIIRELTNPQIEEVIIHYHITNEKPVHVE